MRIWLGAIGAPVLALTDQSVAYALVGWSCAHQWALPVHAAHALFLAAAAAAAWGAHAVWRETRPAPARADGDDDAGRIQRHFLAAVAVAVAALSAAAIGAMWIAAWVISPCTS